MISVNRQLTVTLLVVTLLVVTSPFVTARGQAVPHPELATRLHELRELYRATTWPATSPAELGVQLGHDPVAAAAYLRDNLRYEPYRGALRGPVGTLSAAGGNSVDLTLLLHAMLVEAEPALTLRFAVSELSHAQAEELVALAVAGPPMAGRLLYPVPLESPTAERAASPEAAATGHDAIFAAHAADLGATLTAAGLDMDQVSAFLSELNLGGAQRVDSEEATAAARLHMWLQVQSEEGWLSLDAAAGLPLPATNVEFFDELPAAWDHVVTVAVEVERLADGSLKRSTLIERSVSTAELNARSLEALIMPASMSATGFLSGDSADSLMDRLEAEQEFDVLVGVTGEELTSGLRFDLHGVTSSADTGAVTGGGIGAVDPFARLRPLTTDPADEAAGDGGANDNSVGAGGAVPGGGGADGDLSGLWLVITVSSPDAAPVVVERALLDRIGPAARTAAAQGEYVIAPAWQDLQRVRLALIQRHQAVLPVGTVGLARLTRDALGGVVDGQVLERSVELGLGDYQDSIATALDGLHPPELAADLIAISDSALAMSGALVAGQGIGFLATPNVYLRSETLTLAEGDELRARVVIDIARNRLRVLGETAPAVEAKLWHGILVSEMEGRTLAGDASLSGALWAAQVLREAHKQGIALRLARTAADLTGVTADDDSKAVMAAQLAAGGRLLIATSPVVIGTTVHTAWWLFTPGGQVVAVGPDGRGQAAGEGMMVLTDISIPMVQRTMKFVACFNTGVAGGGSMNGAAGECLSQALQDVVKDTLDKAIKSFVFDPARAELLGEEYDALYEKAKEAYDNYTDVQEGGEGAAGAGAEIGGLLGFRLYLLLTLGSEVAEYAAQL